MLEFECFAEIIRMYRDGMIDRNKFVTLWKEEQDNQRRYIYG